MAIYRNTTSEIEINTQFAKDVDEGLSSNKKYLSSRYFYDKIGDQIFIEIMKMPEYYLTRSEREIFTYQYQQIIRSLSIQANTPFELIELGAGDGTKTIILLKALLESGYDFNYIPIDISKNALQTLKTNIQSEIDHLEIELKNGDYFRTLDSIKNSGNQKIVLFLGSNLGNMKDPDAQAFLSTLSQKLNPGDHMLIGLDQMKAKEIVLPAYNDRAGITSRFNLNLLSRINRELGGNFDLNTFCHIADYDESSGVATSFIESKIQQSVFIRALNKHFCFESGERIHTEISRKYSDQILKEILNGTGFCISEKFMDQKTYFADYVLEKVQ